MVRFPSSTVSNHSSNRRVLVAQGGLKACHLLRQDATIALRPSACPFAPPSKDLQLTDRNVISDPRLRRTRCCLVQICGLVLRVQRVKSRGFGCHVMTCRHLLRASDLIGLSRLSLPLSALLARVVSRMGDLRGTSTRWATFCCHDGLCFCVTLPL